MQRLTFEELLAFVALLLAMLATIAAIAMVDHKRIRTVLWTCLTVWTGLTSVLLFQHYTTGASGRRENPFNPLPNPAENTLKDKRHAIESNPPTLDRVASTTPQRPVLASPRLSPPANPSVTVPSGVVEFRPSDLNAIRASFVGSWTGPLPGSGSPPTIMTITFHADGRMEQVFAEVERPRTPGQRDTANLKKAYVRGRLASWRPLASSVRYDVPTPDTIVLVERAFRIRHRNPFRFAGPDTLIWTQAILNRNRNETTTLVRVQQNPR